MNWSKVLEIGLKVVVAAGAGLAVFKGIELAMNNYNSVQAANVDIPSDGNNKPVVSNNNNGGVVVNSLRAAQGTCGKLFNLTQGLVTVAESISAFRNSGNDYAYYGGYGNNNYYQPQNGTGWRRINPFIIESVPQNGQQINYNAQYPW